MTACHCIEDDCPLEHEPAPEGIPGWVSLNEPRGYSVYANDPMYVALVKERNELRAANERLMNEAERLFADRNAAKETADVCHALHEEALAEIERLRAEIETWGRIWNDRDMLAARVEALDDGSAQLG